MATTGMKAPVAPKPNTSRPTDNMKVANEKRWLRKNGQTDGCLACTAVATPVGVRAGLRLLRGNNKIIGTNTMPGRAVAKNASRQVGKACSKSGSSGRQRSMA